MRISRTFFGSSFAFAPTLPHISWAFKFKVTLLLGLGMVDTAIEPETFLAHCRIQQALSRIRTLYTQVKTGRRIQKEMTLARSLHNKSKNYQLTDQAPLLNEALKHACHARKLSASHPNLAFKQETDALVTMITLRNFSK